MANHSGDNAFTRTAKSTLYGTSNQEYGTAWVQDNIRPEHTNIQKDKVPTYSEIVGSMNDFKRAEKLMKNKVIREKLQKEGVDPNSENARYQKKTEFHVTGMGYSEYPQPGINVGPSVYRTNNMNYGSSRPADFEIQEKYFPCNSNFTKQFNGGTFRFNGLNTVKTVSGVHNNLNDM